MAKAPDAFRTISEVAEDLDLPQHVLRFWETRFSQIKPMKRGGGRRYYRPEDVNLLRGIRHLLYGEGYTIKGVQRILKEQGVRQISMSADAPSPPMAKSEPEEEVTNLETVAPPPSPTADIPKPDPALNDLAASFKAPENLTPGADRSARVSKSPAISSTPPFAVTHNVPQHLVDAITASDNSSVATVPLESDDRRERMAVPADILPDDGTVDTSKKLGRGLLERFKNTNQEDRPVVRDDAGLSQSDVERLQATLVDLLECKRLLDQIR